MKDIKDKIKEKVKGKAKTLKEKLKGAKKCAALVLCAAASAALVGCVYKGAKVTEGTDLAVGLTVPGSEGALTLDVLNYLTGFRLGVAENAQLKVKYTYAGTNDYFGCITTRTYKHIDAKVEPCETDAADGAAEGAAK